MLVQLKLKKVFSAELSQTDLDRVHADIVEVLSDIVGEINHEFEVICTNARTTVQQEDQVQLMLLDATGHCC